MAGIAANGNVNYRGLLHSPRNQHHVGSIAGAEAYLLDLGRHAEIMPANVRISAP